MVKDALEIETTRQAVRIAELSFQSVVAKLRRDWSELEIAHELEATMRFLGATGASFAPIVAAGAAGRCRTTVRPRARSATQKLF